MAAKKKDPKVPFTYAKMSREGAGKKKGPKKMYSDANVNPDGLPWTEEEKAEQKRRAERAREYQGGEAVKTGRKQVKREELRNKLSRLETRIKDAAELNVAREDFLLPEEAGFMEAEGEMEATNKVTQAQLASGVAVEAGRQAFELDLPELGPYGVDWTRNGRSLLLHGAKGHVAVLDAHRQTLVTELHLRETVRDACFLHNASLFAVAQKKHLYLYDRDGVELHCLRQHVEPTRLQFLPFHFLLAAQSNTGWLKYQDVSTGALVAEHRTKLGPCHAMAQNPHNAVIHCGHHNGTVTLWSPAVSSPLVKMLCHRGPTNALSVDPTGRYMATAGADAHFKIWDLRMYRETHAYFTARPVTSMDISQRGLLAVGFGCHLQVWRDALSCKAKAPYLRHESPGCAPLGHRLSFRPYEDVLGLGHAKGFESLLVPGAGEPNYDALEANPFESTKERREAEVHQLLDKLPPETIALDVDFIGGLDKSPEQLREDRKQLKAEEDAKRSKDAAPDKERKRMRGRSKIGAKLKRKRNNIMDQERAQLLERLAKEKADKAAAQKAKSKKAQLEPQDGTAAPPKAISRFF